MRRCLFVEIEAVCHEDVEERRKSKQWNPRSKTCGKKRDTNRKEKRKEKKKKVQMMYPPKEYCAREGGGGASSGDISSRHEKNLERRQRGREMR